MNVAVTLLYSTRQEMPREILVVFEFYLEQFKWRWLRGYGPGRSSQFTLGQGREIERLDDTNIERLLVLAVDVEVVVEDLVLGGHRREVGDFVVGVVAVVPILPANGNTLVLGIAPRTDREVVPIVEVFHLDGFESLQPLRHAAMSTINDQVVRPIATAPTTSPPALADVEIDEGFRDFVAAFRCTTKHSQGGEWRAQCPPGQTAEDTVYSALPTEPFRGPRRLATEPLVDDFLTDRTGVLLHPHAVPTFVLQQMIEERGKFLESAST